MNSDVKDVDKKSKKAWAEYKNDGINVSAELFVDVFL